MITITLPTAQNDWLPSGNPIMITAVSDQHGLLNKLHYLVTVTINGNNVTQLSFPSIAATGVTFDIHHIVADYLSTNFVNDTSTRVNAPDEVLTVSVSVEERYWNGTAWAINSTESSNSFNVWMGAFDPIKYRDLAVIKDNFEPAYTSRPLGVHVDTSYVVFPPSPIQDPEIRPTLSNFKHPYIVTDGSRCDTVRTFTVMHHADGSNISSLFPRYFSVLTLNKDKVLMKIMHKDFGITSAATDKLMSFPCGVRELNQVNWDNVTLYNTAQYNYITPDEDEYYIVYVSAARSGFSVYKPIPFKISKCYRYPVYNVLYKTPEGGWWQLRCSYKSTETRDVKSTVRVGTPAYTPQMALTHSEHFNCTTHVESTETIKVTTGWLDCQGKVDEVIDMMHSPEIYIIHAEEGDSEPTYIPVTFKDGSLTRKRMGMDGLVSYDLEFEKSLTNPVIL